MKLKLFHAEGDDQAYTRVQQQFDQWQEEHPEFTPVMTNLCTREDRGRHHVSVSIVYEVLPVGNEV